jgi:two-component system phosphate regulon sensor histidine kinase PhoR
MVIIPKYSPKKIGTLSIVQPDNSIFPDIEHGHTLLNVTQTGMVNAFQPYKYYLSFAIKVLFLYSKAAGIPVNPDLKLYSTTEDVSYTTNQIILIEYKRSPHSFKHISFIDILEDNVDLNTFKDKIVLIGFADDFNTTLYATPFTRINGKYSNSVEIQAQIIDSLLHYRGLSKTSDVFIYLFAIMLAVFFFFLIKDNNVLIQGISFIVMLFLIYLCSWGAFAYFAIWLPPAFSLILIVVTFGVSIYYSSSKAESKIKDALNNLEADSNIGMSEIPVGINSKVESLIGLLNIINSDRQTIKTIINGVNNGIVVINEKGNISWANDYFIEVLGEIELLNKSVEEVVPEICFNDIVSEIEQNDIYRTEAAIQDYYFMCIANKIKSGKKQYIAIFNDITDMKRLDNLKTDMVRMVSHELKSPLTAIRLSADNIIDIDNRDFTLQNAKSIVSSAELLLGTINNFLNLSRLENNMIEIEKIPSNIVNLINDSINIQKPLADSRNISITFAHDELLEAMLDEKQILIVLNNLLSNAIKYSFDNSEVNIEARKENSYIRVSLQDHGIGIPVEDLERIFHKFFRSSNNKQHKAEGTGLGLSIVQKIIEVHEGQITVESIYGMGSCFSFVLPLNNIVKP